MRNIAVLEKGWLGGGNTGRNTTIIRSNYLCDESAAHLRACAEALGGPVAGAELQRHVLAARRDDAGPQRARRAGASSATSTPTGCNGIDNEWLTPEQAKAFCPPLNISPTCATRSSARRLQRRGGTARHDAVAWGYARGADALRRRHHPELRGHRHQPRRDRRGRPASRRRRGPIRASKIGVVAAGHTSVLMAMAGVRMPLESYPLQALVSEPVKPVLSLRGDVEHGPRLHLASPTRASWSSARGTDHYISYTPDAAACTSSTHTLDAICELFPMFRRMRMLRNWGGIVDVTPDRSPIIGKTPVPGLFVNCGWGTGGFKATPGSGHVFAAHHRPRRAAPDRRAASRSTASAPAA